MLVDFKGNLHIKCPDSSDIRSPVFIVIQLRSEAWKISLNSHDGIAFGLYVR
jgi:hypothetical protein